MNVACKWSMLGKVRTPIHKIKATISGILSKFSIKFKWLQQIFKAFKRWRPTERHLHPCPVNGKSWISSSTAKCNVIRLPKKEHLRKHSLRPFTAVSSARYMYVHMYIHTYTYVHICRFLQGQVGGVCARLIGFDCAYNRYILGRHIGTGTVCMYICMCVCMFAYMYVIPYVSICVRIHMHFGVSLFFQLQRTIKAMDQSWHEECFVCGGPCKKPLVGTSFYERDGRPYCRIDFEQLFAARCAGCSHPITENAIVALNAKWHRDCFKCKVSTRARTHIHTHRFLYTVF